MFNELEVLELISKGTIEDSDYTKDTEYNTFFQKMKEKGLIDFQKNPILGSTEPVLYHFRLTDYGKKVLEKSKN